MPKRFCWDPFGSHRKQVLTNLREVSEELVDTGFVAPGQFLCNNCRYVIQEKNKEKQMPPQDDSLPSADPETLPPVQVEVSHPSNTALESEDEWNENSSNAVSSSDDLKHEVISEVQREQILPAINSVLSMMGESHQNRYY